MGRHDYQELYDKAKAEPTLANLRNLYFWLERFDYKSWNGECFDLGNGELLYPIYDWDKFDEEQEEFVDENGLAWDGIVGYEIRG